MLFGAGNKVSGGGEQSALKLTESIGKANTAVPPPFLSSAP